MTITFASASTTGIVLEDNSSVIQNVAGCTIMAWVNCTSWANTENYILGYSIGTSTSSARAWITARTATGSRFRFSSRRLDADSVSSLDTADTYSTGVWYHICGVNNYTGGYQYIYINGVQNNSAARAAWTANTSNTASQRGRIGIGGGNSTTSDFNGPIADARVYNRVLTPNEILTIASSKGKDTIMNGLQRRWPLGGGAGVDETVVDPVPDLLGIDPGAQLNNPIYSASQYPSRRRA